MKLPEALAAALAAADDHYLIGLSNKGTVNRAKKDMAAVQGFEAAPEGEGIRVKLGDISCVIKVPLGESRCSCPSSGMCRHRITAMLLLKAGLDDQEQQKPDFTQLRAYPTEKLVKILGPKRLAAARFRFESGQGPAMTETSVITVEMPWFPAAVRLLEPLEHSTCTCRSKAFCTHKAEALLYWQLREKVIDVSALPSSQNSPTPDLETVRGICRGVREELTAKLTTGLSRMPSGVCETVERMASLCHSAGLPDMERAFRRLHGEYSAYFSRSASFRDSVLLERLARVFQLASALETADAEQAAQLAGTFRDDYENVGNLRLYLLGMRDFRGRGGYAGTIYYFWERDAEGFYTYTHVRPTFYEGAPKRRSAAPAPWGLPCTLQQAWNCAMDLSGAKASRGGNLSSTEQCRAVLLGRTAPGKVIPHKKVYTDFLSLFLERSRPHADELEHLAVLRPRQCRAVPYDRVRQVFSMQLLDGDGRDVWLEVSYRKEEKAVVDALEQLKARLEQEPELPIVFFGIVYRDGDRLKLYPIEYFTDWEGPDDGSAE